jgi:hypothetical protein
MEAGYFCLLYFCLFLWVPTCLILPWASDSAERVYEEDIAQDTKDIMIRQAKDGASDTRIALTSAPTKQSTAAIR